MQGSCIRETCIAHTCPHVDGSQGKVIVCRTPLAAGVAQNFVNLSLDILLVLALGVGVVSIRPLSGLKPLCTIIPHPAGTGP